MRSIRLLAAAAAAIVVPLLGGCSYDHDHDDYDHYRRHEVLLYDDCGPYGPPPEVVRYRYERRHDRDFDRHYRGYDRPYRDYGYRRYGRYD
jgi:hypothetical protein